MLTEGDELWLNKCGCEEAGGRSKGDGRGRRSLYVGGGLQFTPGNRSQSTEGVGGFERVALCVSQTKAAAGGRLLLARCRQQATPAAALVWMAGRVLLSCDHQCECVARQVGGWDIGVGGGGAGGDGNGTKGTW